MASGGTKIVLCLLPRLQHWQHDVAIHSQYCISLAFCEKVAANLSPQSTRLSMWRGKQPRYGMKGVGSAPSPRIAPRSTQTTPPSPSPSIRRHPTASLRAVRVPFGFFADKSHWSPSSCQCVMGENQSCFYADPCVTFFPLCRYVLAWGGEKGWMATRMVVTIKL